MKDITTPVPPEDMKKLVQKCLEKAARINYGQLMEYAQIQGLYTASSVRLHPEGWRSGLNAERLCLERLQGGVAKYPARSEGFILLMSITRT